MNPVKLSYQQHSGITQTPSPWATQIQNEAGTCFCWKKPLFHSSPLLVTLLHPRLLCGASWRGGKPACACDFRCHSVAMMVQSYSATAEGRKCGNLILPHTLCTPRVCTHTLPRTQPNLLERQEAPDVVPDSPRFDQDKV